MSRMELTGSGQQTACGEANAGDLKELRAHVCLRRLGYYSHVASRERNPCIHECIQFIWLARELFARFEKATVV